MDAKHQFKYTYNETCIDEYSPHEITFEMPGSATLDQILYNFESYLKACGFVFDGTLQIVDETLDNIDTADEIYGCMADFDKDVVDESKDCCDEEDCEYYKSKKLKEWNEGLAKLEAEIKAERDKEMEAYKEAIKEAEDKYPINILYKKIGTLNSEAEIELKKNKWFHGLCNPPSPDWKKSS